MLVLGALWAALGLSGTVTLLSRIDENNASQNIFAALFSLPHAIIFGPIFGFLIALSPPLSRCPFCRHSIPKDAPACYKCTRKLSKQIP